MAADKVFERAWGRPKEYDPNAEAPKKAPPFDPKLYTTDELRRMQEVMTMIAVRQGLLPPEETEQQGGTLSAKRAVRLRGLGHRLLLSSQRRAKG